MVSNDALKSAGALAGIGLAAGLIGSAVMLFSQKAEMAVSGREPSDIPAEAIEKVVGLEVTDEQKKGKLSTAGHFAFGTALGLGLAASERVPEPARTLLFFAGAWSAGNALITQLGLSDPPSKWNGEQLATDLGHHFVYAASAAAAFTGLRRLVHR